MSNKSWGGRFDETPDAAAIAFSTSVEVDKRLAPEDIEGSIAHARMLGARGILDRADVDKIISGLEQLRSEVHAGTVKWDPAREDVHMNLESVLTERIGEAGARLHTGRSRNDQVATDMRLWTKRACLETATRIDRFLCVLLARAERAVDVLLPGYTHLQRAQPVRLAHHLLAWCEMLERDRGRLLDAARRMDLSPLGSGALAATTFPLDREAVAKELGFAGVTHNSLDAVGDRDFLVEAVAALANCAVHLSRFGEELVLWSSQEFGFVQMSDAFTTGSSMMPQKKNPDMAELVRGKSGRVVGHLVSLLVMLKGLPLTYNRDMQEDKLPAFDAFDTVNASLTVLSGCLASARWNEQRMQAALQEGFVNATELADYLVTKGVAFRAAHHVSGKLVRYALEHGKTLSELTLQELRAESDVLDEGVYKALEPETAVERRAIVGGPARAQVRAELAALGSRLEKRGLAPKAVARELGVKES
jgi:argininosuccinate lyase